MALDAFAVGVGIGGSIGAATFSSGAAKAAAASVDSIRIATQVSRELHEHWKAYYASCDAATIAEVCAIPVYVAPATTIAGRSRLEVIRTIGRKRQQLYRGQNVYHAGKMAQDCNVLAAIEAQAALDASEWGFRRAQNLEIQRNQKRLENLYAFLASGRNLLSNALGAAGLAGSIGAQLGAQQGAAIAGWSQFVGFLVSKEGQKVVGDLGRSFEREVVDPLRTQQTLAAGSAGLPSEPEYGSTWPAEPTAFGQAPPDPGAQAPSAL